MKERERKIRIPTCLRVSHPAVDWIAHEFIFGSFGASTNGFVFFLPNFEVAHTVLALKKHFLQTFLAHGKMEITIVVHRWRADLATSLQCA